MWIFLKHGFISVVVNRSDPTHLVVRARTRRPLEYIRRAIMDRGGDTVALRIVETPAADYHYRIELNRDEFAKALTGYIWDCLTYPNFKGEVDAQADRNPRDAGQTKRYAALLHRVWFDVHSALDERMRGKKVLSTP